MSKRRIQALGRLKQGVMNKTETAYRGQLELMQRAGEIVWFKFEGLKFRLADKTFYTPDFAVMKADGQIELHEVKGYWEDDARAKIKIAAELYPFRFIAIQRDGTGWKTEEF